MEIVRMQSSSSSCAASERILALGHHNAAKEVGPLSPVNLDAAEEHIEKIEAALRTIKDRLAEVMKTCPLDASQRSEDEVNQIAVLRRALAQVQQHQTKVKEDMIYARSERRKLQAKQRKAAMVVHKPRAAPPVRMEELRALNMLELDPDDVKARIEQAQKAKGIIPSGGFTNFRVAPDLRRMDFSDKDPNDPDKLESWRPEAHRKARK